MPGSDAAVDVAQACRGRGIAAGMTMGGLAGGIANIAGIDVINTCIHGDPPRHAQGLRRCRRGVRQLPVRMEGREVQRYVGAKVIHHPNALRFNFASRVVLARNEHNLEPNIRLVLEVLERLAHGSELAGAEILIKTLGEAFEVMLAASMCRKNSIRGSGEMQPALAVLIGRDWYDITAWQLSSDGRCVECGTQCHGVFEAVAGQWSPRRQPMRLRASEPEPIVPNRTL